MLLIKYFSLVSLLPLAAGCQQPDRTVRVLDMARIIRARENAWKDKTAAWGKPEPKYWTIYHSLKALPASLRQRLQQATDDKFAIAEPGSPFQVGCTSFGNLPWRRLVWVANNGDKWLILYERGGIAHNWHLIRCLMSGRQVRSASYCPAIGPVTTLAEAVEQLTTCDYSAGEIDFNKPAGNL